MKKIKLNQPYASMVMSGALEVIPNIWDDVKYGEKILIYADEVAEEFKDGLDFHKEFHQKVYNEMVLGNIPDETFITGVFLGYVMVYHTGRFTKYWSKDTDRFLFVNNPHKLDLSIEDYSQEFCDFDNLKFKQVTTKRMKRNGHILTVPVGEDIWNQLRNKDTYKDVFLFWENYMKEIVPFEIWNNSETNDSEPIDTIQFEYQKKSVKFITNGYTGRAIPVTFCGSTNTNWISVFNFDLDCLWAGSAIGFFDKEEQKSHKDHKSQWVSMIFTPMGGMTKWKRK